MTQKIILAAYFGAYLLLTFCGNYHGPFPSGRTRIFQGTWAVRDTFVWEPRFTVLSRYRYNTLGAIFSPLILLDRLVWHRDKRLD